MNKAKRMREEPAVADDFMLKARIIMDNDPFKERAPRGIDRSFHALFGCSCVVAYSLWQHLVSNTLVPAGGSMTHLLWSLMFLKVYPTEDALKRLTGGADQKTTRKWIDLFLDAIARLQPTLVRNDIRVSCVCQFKS